MKTPVVMSTRLNLPLLQRGKVRDNYVLDQNLLIIATDRLSAFDVVFNEGIPGKGRVLTQLSLFWSRQLEACRPYHLVTDDTRRMGQAVSDHQRELEGRTMLVEKLDMLPVECVVRGYLVGSGWKDYRATGTVCGQELPEGLELGAQLEQPLFTPASKAEIGEHDENISFAQVAELVGVEVAEEIRQRSLAIYSEGAAYAASRGLVLVDTKLEFGKRADGTIVLADEVLTPDSSRYWDTAQASATPPGKTPPSYDKQVVRDYLETTGWNKTPPPPALPEEIVEQTAKRYRTLFERLTGRSLAPSD